MRKLEVSEEVLNPSGVARIISSHSPVTFVAKLRKLPPIVGLTVRRVDPSVMAIGVFIRKGEVAGFIHRLTSTIPQRIVGFVAGGKEGGLGYCRSLPA
jgi:hypothetical protein